nr:zinc finger, CCHC-type [Tanacetum cinerariifolium]
MTPSLANNSIIKGFFEKQKLTGPNFIDWYRQLRIGLSIKDKLLYLEQLIPPTPIAPEGQQEEGQSVSSYTLRMKGYIGNLERLGYPVTLGLGLSLILSSLRKEFDGFVQNYNMHSLGKIINELHAMLKLHEQTLPKNNAPTLHTIRAGSEASRKLKPGALSLYVGYG